MNNNDKYRILLPEVEIKKGVDAQGRPVMRVCGVASTMDVDADGEILDPNGFDTDYLIQSGFINWHHGTKDKPSTIIGEPIKVEVRNNKFYVEAELYAFSKIAQEVYELAENLEKSGSNRRLGWSIEGKKKSVDPLNEKFVRKSRITAIAITPMPKNKQTELSIMKGEDADMGMEYDFDTVETNPNGGTVSYIIDITKTNGDRITIDEKLNVKITKAMSTDSSANVLMPESLEQKKKDLVLLHKAYEKGIISEEKFKKIKTNVRKSFGLAN